MYLVDRRVLYVGTSTHWAGFLFLSRPEPYTSIPVKRSLIFERHARGLFGAYVEANKDAVITNTNRGRTFPGILLGPTGNIQGTQKVSDVVTGAIKKCRTIRNLPMPQAIITKVHNWAKRSAHEEHLGKMVF